MCVIPCYHTLHFKHCLHFRYALGLQLKGAVGTGRGPPLWSEFLTTDPEAWVRLPPLPEKKVLALERGPLRLVRTTEELLDRKVGAPV
jgi:hypothetical protein